MLSKNLGEFVFIVIFCTSYALISNIESRLYPVEGSMASRQRAWALQEIDRIYREEEKSNCKDQALKLKSSDKAIVWYHNKQTGEYWCGFIVLNRLTEARANELKGHVTVLNSDRSIRRLHNENNKHKREPRSIPKITER